MCMQKLAEIKGLSEAKVEKLVEAARKCVPTHGWQTGAAVEKQVPQKCSYLLDCCPTIFLRHSMIYSYP